MNTITQLLMSMVINIYNCFTDVIFIVYDLVYTIFMIIQLVTTTPCKMLVSNFDKMFIHESLNFLI